MNEGLLCLVNANNLPKLLTMYGPNVHEHCCGNLLGNVLLQ